MLSNVLLSFLFLILTTLAAPDDNNGDFIFLEDTNIGSPVGVHIPLYRSSAFSRQQRRQRQRREENDNCEGVQIPLHDFWDATYSILLVIGNTTMPVVVDTGSSDLWVIANTCNSTACTHAQLSFSDSQVRFYPQELGPSNSDKSCSDPEECRTGFNSTHLSASLLYGDSHTGTHAFGVIGTDRLAIRSINDSTDTDFKPNDFARSLPTLNSQYFAAINDTNTSVLDTGCAGILGIGFPLNSALLLEIFKSHHHLSPYPQPSQEHRHHHPLDVNYKKRSIKRRPQYMDRDPPYSASLNRRTFPDLSSFTNESSCRGDAAKTPTGDQDMPESPRNGRRHQVSTGSPSPSPPILKSRKPRSNDDNSSPKSLLLSSFRDLGPPMWRLVTNSNKETGSYREEDQPTAIQTEANCFSNSCRDTNFNLETEKPEISPVQLKPMFSISLQRVTSINNSAAYGYGTVDDEESRGVLTIGGLPPGISENDLTWVEVRRYGEDDEGLPGDEAYPITWEIPIEGVYFDGVKLPASTLFDASIGVTALIDTGSSFIRGPPDIIERINHLLRGPETDNKDDDKKEPSAISCSIPHILAFQIGGKMFPIDTRDFVYRSNVDDANSETEVEFCYPNIAPTDVPVRNGKGYLYSWNLGDPFLKRLVYSVIASFYYGHATQPSLDPPRIGLRSTVPLTSSFSSTSSSDVDSGSEINHNGHNDDGGLGGPVGAGLFLV